LVKFAKLTWDPVGFLSGPGTALDSLLRILKRFTAAALKLANHGRFFWPLRTSPTWVDYKVIMGPDMHA